MARKLRWCNKAIVMNKQLQTLSILLTQWTESHGSCKNLWKELSDIALRFDSCLSFHSKSYSHPLVGSFHTHPSHALNLDSLDLLLIDPTNSLAPILPFLSLPVGVTILDEIDQISLNQVPDLIPPLDAPQLVPLKAPYKSTMVFEDTSAKTVPNNKYTSQRSTTFKPEPTLLTSSALITHIIKQKESVVHDLLSQFTQQPVSQSKSDEDSRPLYSILRDMQNLRRESILKGLNYLDEEEIPEDKVITSLEIASWIDFLVGRYEKEFAILENVVRGLSFETSDEEDGESKNNLELSYSRWKDGGSLEWDFEQEIWEKVKIAESFS
ncbi:hypothetical protein HK098_000991 [Nowakowskiella sp. JEL0407]|nr:hypothetical protein HK098_000991 [Nowakowskiella sp. JEL0407]